LKPYYQLGERAVQELLTVMTRKGQITVPAEIRQALGLRVGDKIAVSLSDDTEPRVTLRPVRSVAELTYGAITPRRRPEDWRELRREFEEGVAEEVMAETPMDASPRED
jgi:AbrB family looped-hinge helix DNA binding protein